MSKNIKRVRLSDQPRGRELRARYDSAATTAENVRHWSMADALSADAANSPAVRERIRNRARYEIANNTYAKGAILTLAGDVIGTGPRLQLYNPPSERKARKLTADFMAWSEEICLAEKLLTAAYAKIGDGEAFLLLVNNNKLVSPVKLDVILLEADRVCARYNDLGQPNNVDGVILDENGYPVSYTYMTSHPGSTTFKTLSEWRDIPAAYMCHWFRKDRPEQHRGISEISSALPLFAQERRYTLATLGAAETAADFAAILYTDNPASGVAQDLDPLDEIDITKRMMTTLPGGWKMGQFQPEHPTTTYAEFKREILGEIARCLQMPVNIITGDSSQHNYASGRLDHQTYYKAVRMRQRACSRIVMEKIFGEWMREYSASVKRWDDIPAHFWFWDGTEHVDPKKEADAQAVRLASGTTTLAVEYARMGFDWETALEQRAREVQKMKELGLIDLANPPAPKSESEDNNE